MVSKIRSACLFVIYEIIVFFIPKTSVMENNTLLLIRIDAIGDYILFRNMLEIIRSNSKYKNYRITLLGNIAWRELSECLDKELVDEFIWLDRKLFAKNLKYRFNFLKLIASKGYEEILSPVFSREYEFVDTLVRISIANRKVGSSGDFSNIVPWKKRISDRFYTKLLFSKDSIMFEYFRNCEFFETFLDEKISLEKPKIDSSIPIFKLDLPDNYAVVSLGAGKKLRKWPAEYFAAAANLLAQDYGYNIVLCGGTGDAEDANTFAREFGGEFLNLVGKISLSEFVVVVARGELLLSNESSAAHFGAALDVKNIFVISNGNHLGRFVPYPTKMGVSYHTIFHPAVALEVAEDQRMLAEYGAGSTHDISEITIEMVKKKFEEVLAKSKTTVN